VALVKTNNNSNNHNNQEGASHLVRARLHHNKPIHSDDRKPLRMEDSLSGSKLRAVASLLVNRSQTVPLVLEVLKLPRAFPQPMETIR